MRAAVSLILLVALVACASTPTQLNDRVEFWQRKVARNLHVGMTKEEVKAWGDANHLRFEEQHVKGNASLATFAEDVQDSSHWHWLSGCTGWHIAIYVFLDDSERVTGDRVRSLAICAP